jgi:hypothetical protein
MTDKDFIRFIGEIDVRKHTMKQYTQMYSNFRNIIRIEKIKKLFSI